MGTVVRWLILIPLALLFAIPAGAAVLFGATLVDPVLRGLVGHLAAAGVSALLEAMETFEEPAALPDAVAAAARLALALFVVPPLVVGLAGEVWGARAFLWYAGATGVLTGAMPWLVRGAARAPTGGEARIALCLALAGAVAGAVYWLIAGASAGRRSAVPPP